MKSPVLASILLALALALAACASTSAYAPAARASGAGFSETRIETDRFRVTFRGASSAGQACTRLSSRQPGNASQVLALRGLGGGTAGLAGGFSGGRTSVGAGASVGIPLGGAGWAVARLDIRLGAGPKPADPQAYDARAVLANLGPR
ncbi:MAG: hypothetical protein EBZ50_02420 [Alphaproteobacteria bacterium]|nr:hypothetical protein [Alphaproteobacteria bacterium]